MSETPRVDHLLREMRVDDQDWERKVISLARELETEVFELTNIFELQRKREVPFLELWRKTTGKENAIPDYGEFLKWIIDGWEREKIITSQQRDGIATLHNEYRKLETTTVKLTETNIELREQLDRVDEERFNLKKELTHIRPFADVYRRVCSARGIEKDLLGHIHELEQRYEKTIQKQKEKLEAHERFHSKVACPGEDCPVCSIYREEV